ncbi:hypothetical protein [Escherichia phage UPEC06]|nr:hypothetical protein [Escherichia phage UPEC06]
MLGRSTLQQNNFKNTLDARQVSGYILSRRAAIVPLTEKGKSA